MYSIMLVDDQLPILRGLKALVEATGIAQVVGCESDGSAAITSIGIYKPDMVLLDVSMDGMSGVEVAKEMLEKHSTVRILAVSAYRDTVFANNMFAAGAMGYMLKENAPDELRQAIETVMQGRQWVSKGVGVASYTRPEFLRESSDSFESCIEPRTPLKDK